MERGRKFESNFPIAIMDAVEMRQERGKKNATDSEKQRRGAGTPLYDQNDTLECRVTDLVPS